MLRLLLCSVALVAVCVAAPSTEFRLFKLAFGKEYASATEENLRMKIYEENKNQIDRHNARYAAGEVSFTLGVNQFSDLLQSEFAGMMNNLKSARNNTATAHFLGTESSVPDSYDCRDHGMVTAVKNQGQCGSCWAFAVTGAIEGAWAKKSGNLISLSEQQLVDCSTGNGNQGCNGGALQYAYEYVQQAGGQETENAYPYTARDGQCMYQKSETVAHISGYVQLAQGDENQLKNAVATVGPVAVAIDANHQTFMSYSSGVYDNPQCSSSQLDHGVLVVGYGSQNGKDYWIVKNSWSAQWGDQGYILMSRNKGNQCGIATEPCYPTTA